MLQNRIEKTHIDGEHIAKKRFIIEVPLPYEMILDCFSYNAMNSPTEIKILLMEELSNTINELIFMERPTYVDIFWLKEKLNQVKIIIKE